MPLKTHRQHVSKKHPKHYAKVYWPYMPLLVLVLVGLFLGQSFVNRSQREVLSYATDISKPGLLTETNKKRQHDNKRILSLNPKLVQAAQAKANDMAARNYWSHTTPDGKQPWVFIDSAGYAYRKAGENLAYGFITNNEAINGWMNSPSHRANMLDNSYSEVGFGIANVENYVGTGPETVVVALYATPTSDTATLESDSTLTNENTPITSQNTLASQATVKSVSKAQILTGGRVPAITFGLGLLGGFAVAYLLIKHSVSIKRAVRNGERFVLKHPILDLTLVCLIAVCALLSRSVGFIL